MTVQISSLLQGLGFGFRVEEEIERLLRIETRMASMCSREGVVTRGVESRGV
jgi:hypothetical protein